MYNWPLARYVKSGVVNAPGMPGTFSPPSRVSDPDMHHGTCVTYVPWCMPGSLTSCFLWSQWHEKRSRHSLRMLRSPQFYASGKRPMHYICLQSDLKYWSICAKAPQNIDIPSGYHITYTCLCLVLLWICSITVLCRLMYYSVRINSITLGIALLIQCHWTNPEWYRSITVLVDFSPWQNTTKR